MYERRIELSLYKAMAELQQQRLLRELDGPAQTPGGVTPNAPPAGASPPAETPHHSSIPSFQHSSIPAFQYSNIPILHHSSIPLTRTYRAKQSQFPRAGMLRPRLVARRHRILRNKANSRSKPAGSRQPAVRNKPNSRGLPAGKRALIVRNKANPVGIGRAGVRETGYANLCGRRKTKPIRRWAAGSLRLVPTGMARGLVAPGVVAQGRNQRS